MLKTVAKACQTRLETRHGISHFTSSERFHKVSGLQNYPRLSCVDHVRRFGEEMFLRPTRQDNKKKEKQERKGPAWLQEEWVLGGRYGFPEMIVSFVCHHTCLLVAEMVHRSIYLPNEPQCHCNRPIVEAG